MMKKFFFVFSFTLICAGATLKVSAQTVRIDTVATPLRTSRLVLGGYGEAVMQRMFYSDNPSR
ncbi:MAG: hypothetical protein LBP85_10375, partial [Prevotellaceae bacterium]|nr:hypothetical protein [Prevotellaceae bacterium]